MEPKTAQNPLTGWIVWGALMVSIGIYVGVGLLTSPPDAVPPDTIIQLAFVGIGLSLAVASFVVPALVKPAPTAPPAGAAFTRSILGWAMSEAVALFGFIVLFQGGSWLVGVGLCALGLVLIAVRPPNP